MACAVARVTSVGGRVAYLRGDLDKAKELLEQSRTIARRSELTMPLVLSTNYLAVVCALLDDGEGCRSLAQEIADRARSSLPAHLRQQCRSGLLHAAAALRDPGLADHAEPSITVASWRALSQQVIAELVEQGRDADVYEIVLFTLLLADSADRLEMAAVLDGFFSRHTGWVEISPQEVERRQLAVDRARHAIGAERYERLHEIGQLFSVDQLLSSIADDREADQLLAK